MLCTANASHFSLASMGRCGPFLISITVLCIIITITIQPIFFSLGPTSWRSLLSVVHILQKFRRLLQHVEQPFCTAHEFFSAHGIFVISEGWMSPLKIDHSWLRLEGRRKLGKFRERYLCFSNFRSPALNVPA